MEDDSAHWDLGLAMGGSVNRVPLEYLWQLQMADFPVCAFLLTRKECTAQLPAPGFPPMGQLRMVNGIRSASVLWCQGQGPLSKQEPGTSGAMVCLF